MISSLKQAESNRILLSGEAAMAGRENQGDLWDLTSGLDLQLPIVCAGFRTLSLSLCAKFGALRRTFNEVSSRSSMNWRMGNHVSKKRFYIFNLILLRLRGVSRTVN